MADTFTQIYLHFVFAVENRMSLVRNEWKDELYKYITGIVTTQKHKLLAINGMPDHLHLFVGFNPSQSVSDLLQDIKGSSSTWINEKGFLRGKFNWQLGYGAFSYSRSQIDSVIKYIENQEKHHQKLSFKQEYIRFLKRFDVHFEEKNIFHDIE